MMLLMSWQAKKGTEVLEKGRGWDNEWGWREVHLDCILDVRTPHHGQVNASPLFGVLVGCATVPS
jgi:hypothetical protein